jgi:serine/threonine-protein kinase
MVEDGDDKVAIQLLVAEGILSAEEAREIAGDAARAGQGLLARLRSDGRISEPTFASLCAHLIRQAKEELGDLSTASMALGANQMDHARTWAGSTAVDSDPGEGFPVPGWDRYEPIRLLGQGGMGRVFLARDLRLDRNVAIKFVRGNDPDRARRILGEARAQARVNDDRVCKVYEVGEVRGRVYIAMQHIDGQPLSELVRELSFEQKAIVMRGAALGVAEAHRVGLIHRDLKPSNIMVEWDADGELRPFVMDFGLARDWTNTATMTGTVLGTPDYMAPEQARGEVKQLDRRADVYSLGATLYTLLVGRRPIDGPNQLAVLARVLTEEPIRPRAIDPHVPADLEAIALKCLEKERAARYDSARALADDLGRYLGGEPVEARSAAGLGYRLRKRLRRHRRVVAGVMVAAVLVTVALGFGLRERGQAERREQLARRFTERVERIESMARYSALAPAHDLRPDRDRLRREMKQLDAEIHAGGDLAAGPGHYALGRGHLALDDDDRAAPELAAAWERGHEPRVAYALALVQGRLYQRALREIERSDLPKERRVQRRRDIEQRYREPALRYLRESSGPEVLSPAYVAALIAFYENRFDDALAQLDAIDHGSDGRAWSYEVPLLRGEILHARVEVRPNEAVSDLEAGRRALETAASIGRSVPAVHRARAELEFTALRKELHGGGAVEAPFARGVEAVERVLALLPDEAGALTLRAGFRRGLAEHRGGRGEDVTELLTGAVEDARRAIALDPGRPEGLLSLANTYRRWGEVRQNRDQDPSEQLGQAVQILDSTAADERDAEFYNVLAAIHEIWANYQDDTGQDSSGHRREAIAAGEHAVRIDERSGSAWTNLGENYSRRASQPGADEDGDLARAREALSRVRALDPTNVLTYLHEGVMYSRVAERKQARGDDPSSYRARALQSYEQGAAVSPGNARFPIAISDHYLQQAKRARDHGDPLPALALALAAARLAVQIAPDNGYGYINVGCALLDRADYQRLHGVDPLPAARDAESALRQALEHLPDRPSIWRYLVNVHLLVAGVEIDRSRDPRDRLRLAGEAIDHARALDPSNVFAQGGRDKIRGLLEQWHVRSAMTTRAIQ